MAQLDKTRPSTPLERQVAQAVADIAAELGLESIDPKWVSEAVVAGLQEAGFAVSDRLLETMDEAVGYEEIERKGFEQRLQRLWSPALERLQALIIAASEAGATFALERRKARRWGPRDEALVRIHARSCLIAREVLTLLRAGYASGDHARWRSLHELAVTAFFVSEHGEGVAEAYLLHAAVASRKDARTYQANAETLGYRPLSDLERDRTEAQVQLLARKYGKSYLGTGVGQRSSWTWTCPRFTTSRRQSIWATFARTTRWPTTRSTLAPRVSISTLAPKPAEARYSWPAPAILASAIQARERQSHFTKPRQLYSSPT